MDASTLKRIANERRADALKMIVQANTGHVGGSLSCIDILTELYYDVLSPEDLFLLSKGHSVEGYWAILADLGYFPKSELNTYSKEGARIFGHPCNEVPGVAMCTGALGHGLPVSVGFALIAKRLNQSKRAFVVMGDGELEEGSIWEAAMAASHYHLDNLFAIIDRNGLQISGTTEQVIGLEDLAARWSAFGWDVEELDGNDMQALQHYFHKDHLADKPHMLIAHTIKGKGLPCAENKKEWHHKTPSREQMDEALLALGVKEVQW